MEVVLDSNILFRIFISQGDITKLVFDDGLLLYAPLKLREEFLNNKAEILEKSKLSEKDFGKLCSLLFGRIIFVPLDEYRQFLPEAKQLLGKHEKDEDFIALCLARKIQLWTYESLLIKLGFGVSTKKIAETLSK